MHPLAWFAWLGASALAALLTRNPLYLVELFVIIYVVTEVVRAAGEGTAEEETMQRSFPTTAGEEREVGLVPISPVRFGLFAVVAGALINGLTSRFGETVLVSLPEAIPLLGGAITAEALVYGAVNGLVLATLFGTFAVLNLAVPMRDVIGYLPRAFYPVAVVSAIAVTFVPNTLYQLRQVREAQAIRGHRMRGLHDWLPLFMPVLIGGLERALQLAEAMTARGFAAQVPEVAGGVMRGVDVARLGSIGGLAAVLLGGVLRLVPGAGRWSPWLIVGGTVLMGWAIWRSGRQVHHTRYRRPQWTWGDGLMVAGGALGVAALFVWSGARDYAPYPRLSWPVFDSRVGGMLLAFLLPAFIVRQTRRAAQGDAA